MQCKAVLSAVQNCVGAVQSCAGCSAKLYWVQCKAVLGAVQSCGDRPAGAEVMLKSSLTVSVVGEAPKDARLHTRSCTYTEKVHWTLLAVYDCCAQTLYQLSCVSTPMHECNTNGHGHEHTPLSFSGELNPLTGV